MHTLRIEKLNVSVDDKQILKDFSLTINSGEIHVIMGPNGTGKSTLAKVIMGDKKYKITSGEIYYDDQLINDLTPDKRSKLGIFLGTRKNYAFVDIEGDEDVFIPPTCINGAVDGDTVVVEITSKKGIDLEGRILRIVKRNIKLIFLRAWKEDAYGICTQRC